MFVSISLDSMYVKIYSGTLFLLNAVILKETLFPERISKKVEVLII